MRILVANLEWNIVNQVSNLTLASPKVVGVEKDSSRFDNGSSSINLLPKLAPPLIMELPLSELRSNLNQKEEVLRARKISSKFQFPQPQFAFPEIDDRRVLSPTPSKLRSKRSLVGKRSKISPVSTILANPYENRLDSLLSSAKARRGNLLKARRCSKISSVHESSSPSSYIDTPVIPPELLLPNVDEEVSQSTSTHEVSLLANDCSSTSSLIRSNELSNATPSFHIGTSALPTGSMKYTPLPRFLPKPRNRSRHRIRSLLYSASSSNEYSINTHNEKISKDIKEVEEDDSDFPFLSLQKSLL